MSLSGVGEGQGSAALPAAEPLQLLRYDDASGRFELGARALEALRACSGAVGVVAVCGRARQGKSYVLNRLLGRSSGFTVRAKVAVGAFCAGAQRRWATLPRRPARFRLHCVTCAPTEGRVQRPGAQDAAQRVRAPLPPH